MSKKYECDLCGDTFDRTYVDKGYRHSTRKGSGSAKVKRSLRRRIIRWLIGAPIVLKVFESGRHSWHQKDLCSSCMGQLRQDLRGDSE